MFEKEVEFTYVNETSKTHKTFSSEFESFK